MNRCAWCGQFTSTEVDPMTFCNVLGDPVTTNGPLCPSCGDDCRYLAFVNLLHAPDQVFLRAMRAGSSPSLRQRGRSTVDRCERAAAVQCCDAGRTAYPDPCPWHPQPQPETCGEAWCGCYAADVWYSCVEPKGHDGIHRGTRR